MIRKGGSMGSAQYQRLSVANYSNRFFSVRPTVPEPKTFEELTEFFCNEMRDVSQALERDLKSLARCPDAYNELQSIKKELGNILSKKTEWQLLIYFENNAELRALFKDDESFWHSEINRAQLNKNQTNKPLNSYHQWRELLLKKQWSYWVVRGQEHSAEANSLKQALGISVVDAPEVLPYYTSASTA